jgi:hypothetical protein
MNILRTGILNRIFCKKASKLKKNILNPDDFIKRLCNKILFVNIFALRISVYLTIDTHLHMQH